MDLNLLKKFEIMVSKEPKLAYLSLDKDEEWVYTSEETAKIFTIWAWGYFEGVRS